MTTLHIIMNEIINKLRIDNLCEILTRIQKNHSEDTI